ncbi:ferritin-like domain-containing protein [Burkholderia sp. BE17]|uniref:ferritin-like domain-containing protein n=1 Tax=Burkholderia sp. BE17 TaxID=2656644 RepID=UPI00128D96AB|nr:ferritin-like protein [Burkholderia sp. BE17]MPV68477.1 ferritin-like family protein [Burkholderia sp. BE17]
MNPSTVSPADRDLAWIKTALQSAIELEYSTLPLYLSAMFSLEVQNYSAYNAIRSVVMEEMVHMAIVSNLLAALGGTPQFRGIRIDYPVHGLPGGAEPDLKVGLAQYSKPQLKNFMRIEMPAFLLKQLGRSETYPTIAAFYAGIRDAITRNADAVRAAVKAGGTSNQVGDDIGFTTVKYSPDADPVDAFYAGIDEILQQGEGACKGDVLTPGAFEGEKSHYARFAELYYGACYQVPVPPVPFDRQTEPRFFAGTALDAPVVVNTLAVPRDGYAALLALDPNQAAVSADLEAFDTGFSTILATLDVVWNGPAGGSWKSLGAAVHGMVDLRVLSCFNILRHPVPPAALARLGTLYPDEFAFLRSYSDLSKPVFYGPRFRNVNPPV